MRLGRLILVAYIATISCIAKSNELVAYDEASRELTVPYVILGGVRYNNLVVKLDVVTVVSVDSTSKASGPEAVPEKCTSANISQSRFDAIQIGMTLDDVNSIIGCQYTPFLPQGWLNQNAQLNDFILVRWDDGGFSSIQVVFDVKGKTVRYPTSGNIFKYGSFLTSN